jgi:hypothetical protein
MTILHGRAKTKRGRCEGRPYGYYSSEVATLKRMKELSASGMTATGIATTLRAEGRKTRNGGDWLQPTVSKILNGLGGWSELHFQM